MSRSKQGCIVDERIAKARKSGMSYKEIAEFLDIGLTTVGAGLRRLKLVKPRGRLSDLDRQRFSDLLKSGMSATQIALATGWSKDSVEDFRTKNGGIVPRPRVIDPRYLTCEDREEISRGLCLGKSFAQIARSFNKSTSTVSREVGANGGRNNYRAWSAEQLARNKAKRPKQAKLCKNLELAKEVQEKLLLNWSPAQISNYLKLKFAGNKEFLVSHETIYQSLYIQGRGALKKELTKHLRRKHEIRKHQKRKPREIIKNKVMISDRPPEIQDRAVPGHWEGDLIIGKNQGSQIGTLVERQTRYVMLMKLENKCAETTCLALQQTVKRLPEELYKSITWDQGIEMANHQELTMATNVDVYFCDPHSPWQRGSNENTNGLLRQYFPKGTDLSVHSQEELDKVARELNERPRQTLGWDTPANRLAAIVATTA